MANMRRNQSSCSFFHFFFLLWCWTLRGNFGHSLHSCKLNTFPPSALPHYLVCLLVHFFFLIKHLLIKSWLHVCFVWLISRFSERNWHSLLITVSAYAWLLLHRATDGENTASSQKGRPASSFPRLNPPTAGSQQPPGALSPLLFLLWRCPHMHQCGGVLW